VFGYALSLLWYVQSVPDLGLRTAFSPVVKGVYLRYFRTEKGDPLGKAGLYPRPGDTVVRVGDLEIKTWANLVVAPFQMRDRFEDGWASAEDGLKTLQYQGEQLQVVLVRFQRPGSGTGPPLTFECWCRLDNLPIGELVPSLLWFFLKLTLLVIGALVFWKRP